MRRRLVETFGSFPESSWLETFAEDARGAHRVRIASGFMDQRGARDLIERLEPETRVDVLLGLLGCSGTEVLDELQKRPDVVVRASKVPDFHWKVACIESPAGRVIFVGSANFTRKGMSGRGEMMLRLAGSVLDTGCWNSVQADFEDYFSEHKTWTAVQMRELLARVELAGDKARDAQADLALALEQVVKQVNADSLPADQRVWLVTWERDLTARESALAEREMGPIPADATWTRGEVRGARKRLREGSIVLGDSRDATWFVLGRVGKVCTIDMGRGEALSVADIEHLSPKVTRVQLGGETDSVENPGAYEGIRLAIRGWEDGTLLSADVSHAVLSVLRGAGLLAASPAT